MKVIRALSCLLVTTALACGGTVTLPSEGQTDGDAVDDIIPGDDAIQSDPGAEDTIVSPDTADVPVSEGIITADGVEDLFDVVPEVVLDVIEDVDLDVVDDTTVHPDTSDFTDVEAADLVIPFDGMILLDITFEMIAADFGTPDKVASDKVVLDFIQIELVPVDIIIHMQNARGEDLLTCETDQDCPDERLRCVQGSCGCCSICEEELLCIAACDEGFFCGKDPDTDYPECVPAF